MSEERSEEKLRTFPSVSALMTIPNALRLLLIFLASSSVCPVAPVLPIFSLPARSTRKSEPVFCVPVSVLRWTMVMTKMEWEREDSAFMSAKQISEVQSDATERRRRRE